MCSKQATPSPLSNALWQQTFRRKLLAWFRRKKRTLPWRLTRDPYRIWLSEIMLQQTQVVTVIPYYERFLARFPTLKLLAAADEADVLRMWEGLGYYRRARQLHAAAQHVVLEHGGTFPRTFEEIRSLPGVGRYTAGAIASIAYGLRTPILEANTVRLYSRLLAYRGDPTGGEGQKLLWDFAEEILPASNVGDMNQALMELGSLICTPRNPRCEACPVRPHCPTYMSDLQDVIPTPKKKQNFESVREAAMVVRRAGNVLLRQRPHGERWAGLWDFVRFPVLTRGGKELVEELRKKIHDQTGVLAKPGKRITTIKHGVTRFRITLECYDAAYVSGSSNEHDGAKLAWIPPEELGKYPLSVTGRKLAHMLQAADVPL